MKTHRHDRHDIVPAGDRQFLPGRRGRPGRAGAVRPRTGRADARRGAPGHGAVPRRRRRARRGLHPRSVRHLRDGRHDGPAGGAGRDGRALLPPDLLGITGPPSPRVGGNGTHTDFRAPAILIYEPQADGSMALVAVENLVFARSWRERGQAAPPTFHGVPYDTMIDDPATATDEAHMFEPHFDRHVWIYRDNPNGVFTPFNPAVTCAHHKGTRTHSGHTSH